MTSPPGLCFKAIFRPGSECAEQGFYDDLIVRCTAKEGLQVKGAFVIKAGSKGSLGRNPDAVAGTAEGAREGCNYADLSFVTGDVVMIRGSKWRVRDFGNVRKLRTEVIQDTRVGPCQDGVMRTLSVKGHLFDEANVDGMLAC